MVYVRRYLWKFNLFILALLSEIHSELIEIHIIILLRISIILRILRISRILLRVWKILVNLVFKLRVVLPLWGIFVHHRHIWVNYDLSIFLNGLDLGIKLCQVLSLVLVVLVQSVVNLISIFQVNLMFFRVHVVSIGLVIFRVEVWQSSIDVLQVFILFSWSLRRVWSPIKRRVTVVSVFRGLFWWRFRLATFLWNWRSFRTSTRGILSIGRTSRWRLVTKGIGILVPEGAPCCSWCSRTSSSWRYSGLLYILLD